MDNNENIECASAYYMDSPYHQNDRHRLCLLSYDYSSAIGEAMRLNSGLSFIPKISYQEGRRGGRIIHSLLSN